MRNFNIVKGLALLTIASGLSACGQNNWVTAAKVSEYSQNGSTFIKLDTTLKTGNVTFAAIGLPIMNRDGSVLGKVSVIPGAGGVTELVVDADITHFAKLKTGAAVATLPNGYPIPVTGVNFQGYSLGNSGSEFYASVADDLSTASIGVSLSIPGLAGAVTSPAAFAFTPFTLSTSLAGVAGIFTGTGANQNGFAVFANANLAALLGKSAQGPKAAKALPATFAPQGNVEIQQMLYRLHNEKAHLRIK